MSFFFCSLVDGINKKKLCKRQDKQYVMLPYIRMHFNNFQCNFLFSEIIIGLWRSFFVRITREIYMLYNFEWYHSLIKYINSYELIFFRRPSSFFTDTRILRWINELWKRILNKNHLQLSLNRNKDLSNNLFQNRSDYDNFTTNTLKFQN